MPVPTRTYTKDPRKENFFRTIIQFIFSLERCSSRKLNKKYYEIRAFHSIFRSSYKI